MGVISVMCHLSDAVLKCVEQIAENFHKFWHIIYDTCNFALIGLSEPKDAIGRCRSSCSVVLSCKHECAGNCNTCKQGRFHQPCKKPCNRTLVCGHRYVNIYCNTCTVYITLLTDVCIIAAARLCVTSPALLAQRNVRGSVVIQTADKLVAYRATLFAR